MSLQYFEEEKYIFIKMSFYLFIATLCAKILCVTWALERWTIFNLNLKIAFPYQENEQKLFLICQKSSILDRLHDSCCPLFLETFSIISMMKARIIWPRKHPTTFILISYGIRTRYIHSKRCHFFTVKFEKENFK